MHTFSTQQSPLIVLIEDETAIAEMLITLLEEEGYRVSHAADGEEGLRRVYEEHPSLVVSDVMLPKCDGGSVARMMHADPELHSVPVVLMSAGAAPPVRGPDVAFLKKPFELDTLLTLIALQVS